MLDLDWSALWLSLKVAGCATAINLVLGIALGGLLAAGDKSYRRAHEAQARAREAVAPHAARPTREGA